MSQFQAAIPQRSSREQDDKKTSSGAQKDINKTHLRLGPFVRVVSPATVLFNAVALFLLRKRQTIHLPTRS